MQKQDDDTAEQEAENGENVLQSQEAEPLSAHIPQEHDHIRQEDQLLAEETNESAMEEVRERW